MFKLGRTKRRQPPGPDFSAVDTHEKAIQLTRAGRLERVHLLPLEFGGEDIPANMVYVPIGFAAVKQRIDREIVESLVSERKVTRYEATPQYAGNSFIPIAITVTASTPDSFTTTINIWGEALRHP